MRVSTPHQTIPYSPSLSGLLSAAPFSAFLFLLLSSQQSTPLMPEASISGKPFLSSHSLYASLCLGLYNVLCRLLFFSSRCQIHCKLVALFQSSVGRAFSFPAHSACCRTLSHWSFIYCAGALGNIPELIYPVIKF